MATHGCVAIGCESSGALPAVMLIVAALVVVAVGFVVVRARRRLAADRDRELK